MKQLNFEDLAKQAAAYNSSGTAWHHHFLTPHCSFNQSGLFRMLLENELSGEAFYVDFEERPMAQLKELDQLFHSQAK